MIRVLDKASSVAFYDTAFGLKIAHRFDLASSRQLLKYPPHVPRGFARKVGSATVGSSGQECRGYCPRISFLTSE